MWPSPPAANNHGIFARQKVPRRLLGRAVCGEARICVRGYIFRRQRLRQFDQRALARQQILRVTAVSVDAGKAAFIGVHVIAATTRQAVAAGNEGMADNRVADFYSLYAFADLLDPSRIFVTHYVGKIDFDLGAPDAFDDMQISAADAGSPYSHDYV